VLNLLLFQLGWWALVLSAARGYPGLGLAVVAAILAWHLGFVRPLASEALLIGLAALIGLTFDSLLIATGWVSYGPPAAVAAQALGVATHPVLASASFPSTPASVWKPSLSGPRCAMAEVIFSSRERSGFWLVEWESPQMPHMVKVPGLRCQVSG